MASAVLGRIRREYHLPWRYVANLRPTVAHRRAPAPLSAESARVLADLRQDGVAISSVAALTGDPDAFAGLQALVATQTAARGRDPQDLVPDDAYWSKPFLEKELGEGASWELRQPLAEFVVADCYRSVADHYFGMRTELADLEIWRNKVWNAPPEASQLWHRDMPDDRYVLKMFIALVDIDEGTGPFVYAPGTHRDGPLFDLVPPGEPAPWGPRRSTDDQFATAFSSDRWTECTGPAGTVVFAETLGYHKGGHCTTDERLVLVAQFGSSTCRPRSLGRRYRVEEVRRG